MKMEVFSLQILPEGVFTEMAAHLNIFIAYCVTYGWCAALNNPPAGGCTLLNEDLKHLEFT